MIEEASFDHLRPFPRFRKSENPLDRSIQLVKEIGSQAGNPVLVERRCLANFPKGWR